MKQYKEGKLSEFDEQMETARELYIKGLVARGFRTRR